MKLLENHPVPAGRPSLKNFSVKALEDLMEKGIIQPSDMQPIVQANTSLTNQPLSDVQAIASRVNQHFLQAMQIMQGNDYHRQRDIMTNLVDYSKNVWGHLTKAELFDLWYQGFFSPDESVRDATIDSLFYFARNNNLNYEEIVADFRDIKNRKNVTTSMQPAPKVIPIDQKLFNQLQPSSFQTIPLIPTINDQNAPQPKRPLRYFQRKTVSHQPVVQAASGAGQGAAAQSFSTQQIIEIRNLTPDQIKLLTPAQIKNLQAYQIKTLTRNQIKAFTPEQLNALTPYQLNYAFDSAQIQAFTEEQRQVFTPEQLQALAQNTQSRYRPY